MPSEPLELLDLKMLPAWANEPSPAERYAHFEGEEDGERRDRRGRGDRRQRDRRPQRGPRDRQPRRDDQAQSRDRRSRDGNGAPRNLNRPPREPLKLPAVDIRFLPRPAALTNVTAQIKGGAVAYSVFALARLFLEKPERYDVRVTGSAEVPLYRLGDDGLLATDRAIVERNAFAALVDNYFTVETTQTEPLKGNFTNVARDRLSGTLLGPTNYHSYQPQLRSLYEQRFSRRMSFGDYQKQIEIVSDPTVVEQWKEQARTVTRYTTKNEEPPVTFANAAEAERHFRQQHLPGLIRPATEATIDGVPSRNLQDRGLRRAIEEAWVHETRSPAKMMQELVGAFRQAGLNIFRHRRGMLFVSPIRGRAFDHDRSSVSPSINAVLEKISAQPGVGRKQLADDIAAANGGDIERAKLTLASDLRWLISEGYVIEFNDGSLDLPRIKAPEAKKASVAQPGLPEPQPTAVEPEVGSSSVTPTPVSVIPSKVEELPADSTGDVSTEPAPSEAEVLDMTQSVEATNSDGDTASVPATSADTIAGDDTPTVPPEAEQSAS